jgi:pimeloyl-ACP methyl ester carboxylesterase
MSKLLKSELVVGRFLVPMAVAGTSGPLLVGVNGAQQTMAAWRAALRFFPAQGMRLAVFDLPGQGRGEFLEGPPEMTFEDQLLILATVIDTLRAGEKVFLLGGSWGSVLCAAFAARQPDIVERMVLASFSTVPNARLVELATLGRRHVEENNLRALADVFVKGFCDGLSAVLKAQISQQIGSLSPHQARSLYAMSFLFAEGANLQSYADLSRIRAKVLIVNGGADPILAQDNLKVALASIPNSIGKIVPGVGHFLHFEQPSLMELYAEFYLAQEALHAGVSSA